MLNVICQIIFGARYDVHDVEFHNIIHYNKLLMRGLGPDDPSAVFPWLKYLPFVPATSLNMIKEGISLRDPILDRNIREHRRTYDPDHLRDLTDALLKASQEDAMLNKLGEFSDDNIAMVLSDIFLAGADTTITTLRWGITYLLHWPDVQDSMYNEIINVAGESRYPDMHDKDKMPYTEGVIRETLRLSSIAALGVPHKCTSSDTLNGRDIPKGSTILFNFWFMHRDPEHWKNADVFDPSRWLDDDGKVIPGHNLSYIPFSAGRRVCFGESLAKKELFLILARLIRDYHILPDTTSPLPSMNGVLGITLNPYPFKAVFEPRSNSLSV